MNKMTNSSYTIEQISTIVDKFNSQTLPKVDWTHEAHCIVALCNVSTYEFYDAVCRLKSGIIALNISQDTHNTSTSGYHETITIFWSKVVEIYSELNKQAGLVELINGFLHSPLANKDLPFEFYTKEYLLSAQLRCMYYPPDRRVMDENTLRSILLK